MGGKIFRIYDPFESPLIARAEGIEPPLAVLETAVIPLYQARLRPALRVEGGSLFS